MKRALFIFLLAGCMVGFAGSEAANTISKDEKLAIESLKGVAKITVVRGKRLKSAEVIFTLINKDGKYCIGDMVFPNVPCASGGTHVLQQFVLKDSKIDRAVPHEETKDEFLKRFEKEKGEDRIKFQAEKAERERKKNEEALKIIQKRIK